MTVSHKTSKRQGEINGKIPLPPLAELEAMYLKYGSKVASQMLGVSPPTLIRRIKEYGGELKYSTAKKYIDPVVLKRLYKKYGAKKISKLLNISKPCILRNLRKYNIPVKDAGAPSILPEYWKKNLHKPKSKVLIGSDSPFWKPEIHTQEKVMCKCGCGEKINKYDKKGRRRYFVKSHCKMGHIKKNAIPWNKGTLYGKNESLLKKIKQCIKYSEWRSAVLQKNNYRCIICESKKKVRAHHVISIKIIYTKFLEKHAEITDKRKLYKLSKLYTDFWNINNGITVCSSCHNKIHYPNSRREQGDATSAKT